MNLVEERRSWRWRGLLHGRPTRWRAEQLAGGVVRRMEASKGGARGGGGPCTTRGGGEAAREPNPGLTELAGREETGAASGGASGRDR
jgi:hypothetical protein